MRRSRRRNKFFPAIAGALARPFFVSVILVLGLGGFPGNGFAVTLDGREYLNLARLAERFEMQAGWRKPQEELLFFRDRARLSFFAESREIKINGMRVFLGDAVLLHEEQLHISRIDFETTLRPLLSPQAEPPPPPVRLIAIDPGHGGRDRGTSSEPLRLLEKNLTLEVSQRLARRLTEEGYRIHLIRTGDVYIPLEARAEEANSVGADLFVSIHFNSVGKADVRGVETYLLTPRGQRSTGQAQPARTDAIGHPGNQNDHWNSLFGFLVHRQLLHDLEAFDRGLKRARFAVLRTVECPALLIEGGYLSNLEEARRLQRPEYQDKLVDSLVTGINQYRQATERIAAARQ